MSEKQVFNPEYFFQDDVCRLCWKRGSLIRILPKKKDGIAYKIEYCLNIYISSESFPTKLCADCYDNIKRFYNFKISCKEKERRIRDILTQNTATKTIEPIVKLEVIETSVKIESCGRMTPIIEDDSDTQSDNKLKCDPSPKYYLPPCKKTPTYCNICRIEWHTDEKFILHNEKLHGVIIQNNTSLYKCLGCEKCFSTSKLRLRHEMSFCKELRDGYLCLICQRHLPNRRWYECHMRDHGLNRNVSLPDCLFKCKDCVEKFQTREELKIHAKTHTNENKKLYVCEYCGRGFAHQRYLTIHIMLHTGLKRYVCPQCGYRARQKSTLNVHMLNHKGERPFSCSICPQKCLTRSNLRAHMLRHEGYKRYECTICNLKFGYKDTLAAHIAVTHDRTLAHYCDTCNTKYSRLSGLQKHIRKKHSHENGESSDLGNNAFKII